MKSKPLEKRLFKINPIKNGVGKFIPYCNYDKHRGVVKNNNHSECERLKCHHYIRLYISSLDTNNKFK